MSTEASHNMPESPAPEKQIDDGKQEFEIHEECAALIHAVTGQYDLVVTTDLDPRFVKPGQNPDDAWFAKFKQDQTTGAILPEVEYVRIPETIRARRVEFGLGAAIHEAAHVVSSRFSVIPEDVMKLQGFSGLMASVEERPTDQVARERVPAGDEWIAVTRRELSLDALDAYTSAIKRAAQEAEEEDVQEHTDSETEESMPSAQDDLPAAEQSEYEDGDAVEYEYDLKKIQEFLKGRVRSRYQDFCNLIVFDPHYSGEEASTVYHPDAIATYEKIREYVERIEKETPEKKANEKQIQKKQQIRYALAYKHLLPVVQDLIEADVEDARRRAIKEAEARKKLQESDESDELKKQVDGLYDVFDDVFAKRTKKEAEKIRIMTSDLPEEEKEKELIRVQEEIDEIDARIKEIQDEIWKLFPDWLKELLRIFAKQYIEDVEDKLIIEHGGKFTPKPIQTNRQRRVAAKQAQQAAAEERRAQQERERARKEQEETQKRLEELKKGKSYYEREYEEIRHLEEELYAELYDILYPNTASQTTFHSTGSRINLKKLFLWKGQKAGGAQEVSVKPFEQTRHPEVKDYAITILVDLSGSMQGGNDELLGLMWEEMRRKSLLKPTVEMVEKYGAGSKIKETLRGVIILGEVLNRLGIRLNVLGLADKVLVFKDANEELNNEVRDRIAGMLLEAYTINPNGNNYGGNWDGECVAEASEILEHEHAAEKVMLVLSDGQPSGVGNRGRALGLSAEDHLLHEVIQIISKTDQKIIGLGLGPDTKHVEKFYPLSRGNIDIRALAATLADILKMVITQPEVLAEAVEDMKSRIAAGDWHKMDDEYDDDDDEYVDDDFDSEDDW